MVTEAQREQQERREVMKQDLDVRRQQREERAQGSTYLDHHHSELGGRFGVIETETITGRPSPQPPPLPPTSPWSGTDPVGIEPPLGYEIDAMPPIDPLPETCAGGDPGGAAAVPPGVTSLTGVSAAPPPSSQDKGDDQT
jgi:hypothetical protein